MQQKVHFKLLMFIGMNMYFLINKQIYNFKKKAKERKI
jgi:hypothetical protein